MINKILIHETICKELNETYKKKNADYGDSVGELYAKLGDITLLTRISDKYNRLMNLLDPKKEGEVNYESVDDTILDMANYCIIWLMERRLKNSKCIMDKINQSNSEIKIEDESLTNSFGSFIDFADVLKKSKKNNETKLDDSGIKLKTSKNGEKLNELLDEIEKDIIICFSEEEMIESLEFLKETREKITLILIEICKHL